MDFADPHFAEPGRLWALVPLALVIGALWAYAARARRRAIAGVASPAMLNSLLAAHSPGRRLTKNILFASGAALLVVALARPCWGFDTAVRADDAEDVVFLLDTSRSMTARDVAPDRLGRAKRAIATFVGMHPGGRLGLVAFAGDSFIQCPPTGDRDMFNETLDAMDTEVIRRQGTDIGGALEAGRAAFGEPDKKAKRTIVMLTDGEDLDGRGVEIAQKLGREGVVVHCVGIGGPGFEIPAHADGSGGMVSTGLDEKTLREIAAATGGEYFRLDGKTTGFSAVEAKLGRIATSAGATRTPLERFVFPLALAAVLLAAESLIGTRRPGARRVAPLAKAAAAVLFGLLVLRPAEARADTPAELFDKGADALKRESYAEAADFLKNALEDAPADLRPPALHNLGQARARGATKVVDKHFAEDVPKADPAGILGKLLEATGPVDKALRDGKFGFPDKQAAMQAYGAGRAARKSALKDLRVARENLAQAEGAVVKLERARDDFLGAAELDPKDVDAAKNAAAIDEYLRKLKQKVSEERKNVEQSAKAAADLKNKLSKLRKMLDPSSGEGEGDDDDDEDGDPKKGQGGKDSRNEGERREQEGKEGKMSREEAAAALEAMREALRNKIPANFGQGQGEPRPDNNRNDR